jgi:hypothetical protein
MDHGTDRSDLNVATIAILTIAAYDGARHGNLSRSALISAFPVIVQHTFRLFAVRIG